MYEDLVPGLETFMEDYDDSMDDDDIDAVERLDDDSDEMAFALYDFATVNRVHEEVVKLTAMRQHIQTYGTDRTMMALLTPLRLNIAIPAIENFTEIPATDAFSIACMEAIDNKLASFINTIKTTVWPAIVQWAKKFWQRIRIAFKKIRRGVKRIFKRRKNAEADNGPRQTVTAQQYLALTQDAGRAINDIAVIGERIETQKPTGLLQRLKDILGKLRRCAVHVKNPREAESVQTASQRLQESLLTRLGKGCQNAYRKFENLMKNIGGGSAEQTSAAAKNFSTFRAGSELALACVGGMSSPIIIDMEQNAEGVFEQKV